MRVHVKLLKSVTTLSGQFQQFTGDLDERTGIVWMDPVQGGRVVRAPHGGKRMGVVLTEGSTVVELPEVVTPVKGKQAKDGPAA